MKALVGGGTRELRDSVARALENGWDDTVVLREADPLSTVPLVRREEPALLVLAPDDVLSCCRLIAELRQSSEVPLVVVGDCDDVEIKVSGLEAGADDLIRATCMPVEFVSRVHAVLRRCALQDGESGQCRLKARFIDPGVQEVRLNGLRVPLTSVERGVLSKLSQH